MNVDAFQSLSFGKDGAHIVASEQCLAWRAK